MLEIKKNRSFPWLEKKLEELKTFEDGTFYKKVMVMSKAGGGKTTFAGTFPNWLLFDFDKNSRVLEALPNGLDRLKTHRLPFSRGDDVETGLIQTMMAYMAKEGPFADGEIWSDVQTIVIDSIHKYASFLATYIQTVTLRKKASEKMGYDGWGLLKGSLETLGELIKDVPCHVVSTCGVKTFDRDDGTQEVMAMIDGSYKDLISHEYGEVYYLDRVMRSGTVLYKGYSNIFGNIKMLKTTTPYLPREFVNPTFQRLYVDKKYD